MLKQSEWTLTCKKCNNEIGSSLESQEARRIATDNGARFRVRYWQEDESIEVPIELGDKNGQRAIDFDLGKAKGRPETIDRYIKRARQERQELTPFCFGFNKPPFDSKKADLAYLHGAYLHLFHQFGYSFSLSNIAVRIKKQLWSPHERHYPVLVGLPTTQREDSLKEVDGTVTFIVTEPIPFVGFLVVTPKLKPYNDKRKIVLIPMLENFLDETPHSFKKPQSLKTVLIRDYHNDLTEPHSKDLLFYVLGRELDKHKAPIILTREPPSS